MTGRGCAWMLTLLLSVPCAAEPSFQLKPSRVEVDLFFRGAKLVATGTVPADCRVVLKLEGERRPVTYRRKDKRGPLWISTGRVVFDSLPGLYAIAASSDSSEVVRQLEAIGEGFDALRQSVAIEQAPPGDDGFVFNEFLRLESGRGLYSVRNGAIVLSDRDRVFADFRAEFRIPAAVRPGVYRATLYCFRERHPVSQTVRTFSVEKIGLVRAISDVAFRNGGLYGVVSVVVALAAGLVVGVIFRKL